MCIKDLVQGQVGMAMGRGEEEEEEEEQILVWVRGMCLRV